MSATLYPLLANAAGSVQCPHGGVFKDIGSTTSLMNGDPPCSTKDGFPIVVTPCPLNPASPPYLPPCLFATPAATFSIRVTLDTPAFKPVTAMTPQISSSNGIPAFIAKTKTTTVKVL